MVEAQHDSEQARHTTSCQIRQTRTKLVVKRRPVRLIHANPPADYIAEDVLILEDTFCHVRQPIDLVLHFPLIRSCSLYKHLSDISFTFRTRVYRLDIQ